MEIDNSQIRIFEILIVWLLILRSLMDVVEWRMDHKGNLWTIAGAKWDPGMDWLGGLAETAFGEVVRLEDWEWRW